MRTNLRKLTSLLTLLGLLLMTFSGLAAPNFRDLDKHWAQGYIRNWANQGLVAGYTEDSTFRPDNPITKAEFITLVNRVMGYTELKEADFPDVPQGSWFRGDVFKSLAIGYAEGYADGTFGPNQPLSREEAALMIYRIMKLENSEFENVLADFKDAAKIAPANQEALNAVVASGYLRGYPDQTIQPQWTTTRAEMIILLDRIAGEKYLAAGTYGPQDGLQTIKTNVTVSKPGITLRNMAIEGDLHLTEGIGAGDVTLENVTVKGRTLVAGGGRESVHVTGTSSLGNLEVHSANREVVRIVVDNTEILIDEIMLRTGAIIEFPQADGRQVATLTIAPQTGRQESPQQFTISGNLGQVVVQGNPDGAPINLQLTEDASIQELVVEEGAKGIQVTSAGSINQLNVAAPEATINITGGKIDEVNLETKTEINMTDGTVGTLKVEQEAAGSTITTSGDAKIDETDLAEDTTIIIDGKEVSDKPTPTPDSGPGPTTPSKTAVRAISVDPVELTLLAEEEKQITVTVSPTNATNKRVTWESDNEEVATVVNGLVTGVKPGTATITATSVADNTKIATTEVIVFEEEKAFVKETGEVFDTIQKAINAADEGNTILVGSGTFEIDDTLNITKPLTIKGMGPEYTVIDVMQVTGEANCWGVLVGKSNTVLCDLAIVSTDTDGRAKCNNLKVSGEFAASVEHLNNIVIENVVIEGGKGLDIFNADVILENVTIKDSQGASIAVSNGSNVTIRDCTTIDGAWGSVGVMYTEGYGTSIVTVGDGNEFGEGVLYCEGYEAKSENEIVGLGAEWQSYIKAEEDQFVWVKELPEGVYVENGNGLSYWYASIDNAIEAVGEGDTIKLYDDIETTERLQLTGKNVAFDLNGKSLNTKKLEVNNSTVVFGDSSENGEGTLATDDSYGVINAVDSNVTIQNGRFVSNYNKAGSSGYANVIQVRNSELTINGGYFENTNNVGSYNYLIKAPSYSGTEKTTITINSGTFVSNRNYGYIVTGGSDAANVNVVINGGAFTTTGRHSFLTNVKGSVVVNDCTFTATGNNTVFDIPKDSTVTVKGGTFSVNENSYTDPSLAGLIFHRKTNGWTNVNGTLLVAPVNPVKVNQQTYLGFLAEGATESAKDADGFYTITK